MASVKDTYNKIANDFDITRYRVWPRVEKFLNNLDKDKCGLEIGCGNGKNMLYRNDIKMKGIDICESFVEVCKKKGLDVIQGDMVNLPINETFDFVFSIAVLHHLDKKENRIRAINEMFRVCKDGGLIFVLVWAFEQEADSKRKFNSTDEMVSWKCRDDGKTYYRYYHLYKKNELLEEFNKCDYDFTIVDNIYEKGNWGIIIKKSYHE
jgi:SAM-dependent methyltransferase